MKKRLSLLMAAIMMITMLPISAFAAAVTDSFVIRTFDLDTKGTISGSFVLPIGATVAAGDIVVELEGAIFDDAVALGVGDVEINQPAGTPQPSTAAVKLNDTQAKYTIAAGAAAAANLGDLQLVFTNLPLEFDKEGTVKIHVRDVGNTGIGNVSAEVARVVDRDTSELSVVVKDAEKAMSFDGGRLSQFEVRNIPNGTQVITIDAGSGFTWDTAATTASLVGTGLTTTLTSTGGRLEIVLSGPVALPADRNAVLYVTPEFASVGRKVTEGDVQVSLAAYTGPTVAAVDGPPAQTALRSNRAVIGKVVDYKVSVTVVENGKKVLPSVWGGEEVDVKVTLKGPKGSLSDRPIDFKVDGADVEYIPTTVGAITVAGGTVSQNSIRSLTPAALDMGIEGEPLDGMSKYLAKPGGAAVTTFDNGEFSVRANFTGAATTTFDQEETISFVVKIVTDGDKDGVATITAAQRGWETTADLAKVTPKFAVKAEVTPLKKGEIKDTAEVVLTEAKAGLLKKGENITLTFDTRRDYVEFTNKDIKIEATNGMTFGKPEWQTPTNVGQGSNRIRLVLPIEKASYKDPAEIKISGLKVRVDGSVADDTVKLIAGLQTPAQYGAGTGIKVGAADYIKVVKEYALESIKTVFTIGQTAYTVNNEAKSAAAAPYVKNGRTMLPIRAVAESLGLTVQWNGATKTASFTDDTKVAAVVIGAEVMYVNGTPIPLAAKAELVNGTTFVELRSLATAFGVQIDWDAATKQAIVSK